MADSAFQFIVDFIQFFWMRFLQYPEHWILIGMTSIVSTLFFIWFILSRNPTHVFIAFAIIIVNIFLILYFVMIESQLVQPLTIITTVH